jgi:mRNA interferase MazF
VVSVAYGDADRAIVTVVPHTTALRGSPFEISVPAPFLRRGAFLVQGVSTYPKAWAIRKIGALDRDQMAAVMTGLRNWLGFADN